MQVLNYFRKLDFWLAFSLAAVYVRGLFLDVMDVDASQYASIAMEMQRDGSWLEVMHRGADYLDKPPLLFWTSAASFALFGISNWAYKLPSFLAAIAAIFAVYRFSLLFYSPKTAKNAAFILASSLGLMLISNDVRTDTLLLGMTACAVWQFAAYLQFFQWKNLLAGAVFAGLGMLAKGPIGLVVPIFGIGTHLLLRREWGNIFRWQWLVGLLVIAAVLFPMCWGLYHQFDLHPEKPLNDRRTSSGLYFFFWEQSFGRVTGENVWKDDSTPLFFVHTYLWAFLPWAILFAGALWSRLRAVFAQKWLLPKNEEAYTLGAFLFTFAALSLSKYKLPHYIFVTLPFASVLTARFLEQLFADAPEGDNMSAQAKGWISIQYFVLAIVVALSLFVVGYVFFSKNIWIWAALITTFGSLIFMTFQQPFPNDSKRLVQRSILASIGLGVVLNGWFYPQLLPYQSTGAIGKYAQANDIPAEKAAFFLRHGHALDFYARFFWQKTETPEQVAQLAKAKNGLFVYTTEKGKMALDSIGVPYVVTKPFDHFQVARLNTTFLNPNTRAEALEKVFLLEIK